MEGLENTGDKKTSRNGAMMNGGIGEHRGQRDRQDSGTEGWRDWRNQGIRSRQDLGTEVGGIENIGGTEGRRD